MKSEMENPFLIFSVQGGEKSLSAEHKTNLSRIMFYCVKRILPMRSMKRHKATGEMMVRVMWADEHESVTVEPLSNFYDGDRVNVKMNAIINEYDRVSI
jgi:hypothetical protein